MPSSCLCVSVCVRHTPVFYQTAERRMTKIMLHNSHGTLVFLCLRGRQMQVGWVKIGNFRRKTHYNSKTVQDKRIVSNKVEKEVVCAQSNGYVADDLG